MRFYLFLLINNIYRNYNNIQNNHKLNKVCLKFDNINLYNESNMNYTQLYKINEDFKKLDLLKKLENPNINVVLKLRLIDEHFQKNDLTYNFDKGLEDWE